MKKGISFLLVLVMLFSLSTAAFATDRPTGTNANGTLSITQETIDATQGIYKLVATAKTSVANVLTFILSMSYDSTVVQPMSYDKPNYTAVTPTDGDTTTVATFAKSTGFVDLDTAYFSRTGCAWEVLNNRTAFALTMKTSDDSNGTSISSGMIVAEFYFKILDGKTLAKNSIRLERSDATNSMIASLFTSENQQNAVFFGLKGENSDLYYGSKKHVDNLDTTLVYPNSTVDTLVSTAINETPALTVAVPTKAEATKTIQLAVTNTGVDGPYVGDAVTTWSITSPPTGVSIDASSGQLTVRPDALGGNVTVTASTKAGTVTTIDTATVSITKATAAVTKVLIYKGAVNDTAITTDTITVPNSGAAAATQAYTAQAYDQYGAEMSGQTYAWTVVTALTGASITPVNTAATTVSIAAASVAGDYKIKAAVGSVGSELTITTTRNAAVATTITVTTSSDLKVIVVPADNATAATKKRTATVKDQYGTDMTGQTVTWTIKDSAGNDVEGITINNDGTLSVTNEAKAAITDTTGKIFTITANCGSVSKDNTAEVTIKRAAATATSVKIFSGATEVDSSTSIVIPLSGANRVVTYTPKLYDQYGTEMTCGTWTWAETFVKPTDKLPEGTSRADGTVTVAVKADPADANTGSFTLKATGGEKSKEITIIITKINANWSAIKTAESPVYGTTNGDIIIGEETTTMSYNLDDTTTYGSNLSGSYVVTESATAQDAGDNKTITVTFTANQDAANGEYKGVVLTKDFTVKIGKAIPTAAQLKFKIPTDHVYTAEAQGIGDVTAKTKVVGLGAISVKYGGSATAPTDAGTYAVTAEIADGTNYAASASAISLGDYKIGAAEITDFQTTAPAHTVLANNAANKSLATLKAIAASGSALPANVTVTYGSKTAQLPITWAESTDTYNVKGGTYTYKGTVTNGDNFKAYATTLDAKVTVTPVKVQTIVNTDDRAIAATVTKAKADVTNAGDLAEIGVPANVKVTFDGGVTEETSAASWDKTLSDAKSVADSVTETSGDEKIVFTLKKGEIPDWATLPTSMPTITLTITNKYPVTVSFTTAVDDVTYGTALATPVATQTAIKNGTDASGTFKYTYVGVSPTVYAESATVPTEAGSYKVIATLESNTHSGTAEDAFKIAKKDVTITFTDATNLTYDKTPKAVTAAIIGGIDGDDVSAVLSYSGKDEGTNYPASAAAPVNAGSYTATVTGLTGAKAGNYKLTSTLTRDYTIAKADRAFTVTAATLNLAGNSLTGEVGKTTFADLDKSAVVKYTSDNTAVATVNNGGRVTAVGNGTADINATIAETENYNAQVAVEVAKVTAVTTPITGITSVASSTDTDKLSASISGNTIKLAGFVTTGATITVAPTYAANTTLKGASPITLVADAEALKTGGSFIVTAATIDVNYIIDTSAVVLKATNVEMGETDDVTDADDIKDNKKEVTDALENVATKAEDLLAAAAKALLEGAGKKNDELTDAEKTALGTGYSIKAEVYLKISATAYTSSSSLALEITPWVKYSGVAGTGGTGGTADLGSAKLENSAIKAPVKISLALPKGFPDQNLFAKHTKSDGTVEILTVTVKNGVATWYQSSFSKTELFADTRAGNISYTFEDGTHQIINYTAKDIGTALPNDTKSGNTFNGWTIQGVTDVQKTMTDTLLTAINNATKTATPSFTPAFSGGGDTTSNLTINASAGEGGTITPSGKLAVEKNGSMSFAIKPNEGYSIDTILVDGKAIGKVSSYTFKNVTENHSIAVTFKKGDDFAKFIDVKGHWAESAMRFVFENEIMSGMSQITFEPETELSRAMLVTMLYRIDGKPAVSSKPSFKDVASGMWYTDAIAWAEANKIISGLGDGNFAPNASIQRQQMAAILYRYMQFKGRDVSGSSELTAFTDAKMIGDWALPAMKWAVQEKLISGRTASTLEPLGTAKRAEVAMVMMRWLQK